MLDYAAKLSLEPWNMDESDVQQLRDAGFSNTGILDIAHVTGYYAYVNRLAGWLATQPIKSWKEKLNEGISE